LNKNKYMLGVDIGTTSTKAILYCNSGEIILEENNGYELHTPDNNTAELDPDDIFQAVIMSIGNIMSISKINPKDLTFISFSSAMHSVIAMDDNDKPITRCITWADNRSSKWANKIKDELDGHNIYLRTGTPIHPMSPLSKITWLENDMLSIAKKTKKYIGIKEYIFLMLFNKYIVDYSIASCMGMLNLKTLTWDEAALKVANINENKLSQIVPTTEVITGCNRQFLDKLGILPSTQFVIGASDGVLSNLGLNAVKEGEIAITIGTSGAIRTTDSEPKVDLEERIFCYALTEKHWIIGGPVNNGGVVLNWLKDLLYTDDINLSRNSELNPYKELTKIASTVRPGANGLLFHPFLAGERAPLWNANVRGSFFGLTLHHEKKHLIRAVLEGVIFNLYSVYEALSEVIDVSSTSIKASGGFVQSELWRQILSDMFDLDVIVPENRESSCLGACLLGLYALNKIESLDISKDIIGANKYTPNQSNVAEYRKLIPIFKSVSKVLEFEYDKIADYQASLK